MNAPRLPDPPVAAGRCEGAAPVALCRAALDALMPMHLVVAPTGHIRACGPTLARLRADCPLPGARLLEAFEFLRPAAPLSLSDLLAAAGRRLSLRFRAAPRTAFKGLIVPLAAGQGALMNLSFGIGAVAAVADHRLTAADFAPTDLTVELLYLVEAKSAAMEEWRRLSRKLEGARSAAEEQALTDALTGLRNRRALEEALGRLIASGQRFGLMHLDLDRFKAVNDSLGHAAGDAVLGAVARALRAEVREEDIAARVGGDEFVLLFPGVTDTARLERLARRIIARIEEPVPFGAQLCRVSASVGVTVSSAYRRPEPERMLRDADEALYAAKRAGRGQARVHRPAPEG
ncbi:MAG: GGDEF domain-containing protein [Rhodobacteraceae bacterium]|nr:GGDEF domain-containing protein [Paracoccaceae bacterium]